MKDEIKEILSLLNSSSWSNEAEKIEDYITNLQQENSNLKFSNQALNNELGLKLYELDHLDEKRNELKKDELKEYVKLQQENEKLKAQLTDTEWEYQNTRCKYEKQYKKGITEELLEDIETCFFNRENPSMIPIDSLDVCHIFGYIDYLKDYKSRCEKAVEYIEEHIQKYDIDGSIGDFNEFDMLTKPNYLLNILQK